MHKLVISPAAEKDLEDIFEYSFYPWGYHTAEKYQDDFFNAFEIIRDKPLIGQSYQHTEKPYRVLHINRHLVFYRVEKETCIIVRILHERMDITTRIK